MPYPPPIDDAVTFPTPPPVAVVAACPHGLNQCGIASLGLAAHPAPATSFDAAPGAPLASGANGRFVFAPVVEGFDVTWTLTGHAFIQQLRLELYGRRSAVPLWTKTLDYRGGGIGAAGSTHFNGDLRAVVHAA